MSQIESMKKEEISFKKCIRGTVSTPNEVIA